MGTIQGEFAKRQAGVGAKRGVQMSRGEMDQEAPSSRCITLALQYKAEKEGR